MSRPDPHSSHALLYCVVPLQALFPFCPSPSHVDFIVIPISDTSLLVAHAAFLFVRGALRLVWRPCRSRLTSVWHLYLHGSLFYLYCLGHHIIPMLSFDLPHSVGNMPSSLLIVSFWCLIFLSLYIVPLPRSFTNYQSFCPHCPPTCPYHYFRPHDLEKPL
jgi:hypothetical protein